MYVCVCKKVTDKQIRQARDMGASSVACLKKMLDVATCCGRCHDCAEQVLKSPEPQSLAIR
ncbi:MAG: (2Fe-2S)-binding protein [Gammaproteobacteria bacterium]|nr:(2Fe-2S)-binding protein [Gammaproteobacteria bacterium]